MIKHCQNGQKLSKMVKIIKNSKKWEKRLKKWHTLSKIVNNYQTLSKMVKTNGLKKSLTDGGEVKSY